MLIDILRHTPMWVFAVFAALLWLGARQLTANATSMRRTAHVAAVMGGLSLYGVVAAFGESAPPLLAWAAAACAAAAITMLREAPAGTRYDAAARRFLAPGSAVPLLLMMGIFWTKYAMNVALVFHPDLGQRMGFALPISALYGGCAGIFMGRALRLWRLRADTAAFAA